MELRRFLQDNRSLILQRWFEKVVDEYPAEGRRFISNLKKDRFENPAGFTILEGLNLLFDHLLHKVPLNSHLEDLIKLRAVQDFKPSEAVRFVFRLKGVIQEMLSELPEGRGLMEEFMGFSFQIDELALRVFDIYMESRERLNEVKVNEMRNMTAWILKKVNILKEDQGGLQ